MSMCTDCAFIAIVHHSIVKCNVSTRLSASGPVTRKLDSLTGDNLAQAARRTPFAPDWDGSLSVAAAAFMVRWRQLSRMGRALLCGILNVPLQKLPAAGRNCPIGPERPGSALQAMLSVGFDFGNPSIRR